MNIKQPYLSIYEFYKPTEHCYILYEPYMLFGWKNWTLVGSVNFYNYDRQFISKIIIQYYHPGYSDGGKCGVKFYLKRDTEVYKIGGFQIQIPPYNLRKTFNMNLFLPVRASDIIDYYICNQSYVEFETDTIFEIGVY